VTTKEGPDINPVCRCTCDGDRLRVTWADGGDDTYSWIWVRDHSHDPATLHPVTQQRLINTATATRGLRPASAEVHGADVVVTWHDGSTSTLPGQFLRACRPGAGQPDATRVTWDAATIETATIHFAHDAVIADDDALGAWLDAIATYGFAIVDGTPTNGEATRALIRRIGYIRETIFGGFWEFSDDLAKADTAYTNLELLPHTDGTYSHDAPGLQILHCLRAAEQGGDSTIVDGLAIAERLRRTDPGSFAVLSTTPISGQYIGDGVHLTATRPVIRLDDAGQVIQISYNTGDRAPINLDASRADRLYDALFAFDRLTNDPAWQWRHILQPGEALVFDNWRVLHGRHGYRGARTMCGAYVNREDYESRRRVLRNGGLVSTTTAC
jgi:trimethyllysine dioxygenase